MVELSKYPTSEDIPLLAQHFLERATERSGKEVHGFNRGAIEQLMNHTWPGNIRELQNAVERAVVVYSRGASLTDTDIRQSLGIREPAAQASPLNLRQREVLAAVGGGGTTVSDLLTAVASGDRGGGRSKRTLQNDLRRLLELEYLAYYKEGSVRLYRLTEEGKRMIEAIAD